MITIKKPVEIKTLKEGGHRLALIMLELKKMIKPGQTGEQINKFAHSLMLNYGGEPSFLNYKPSWAPSPFPASICLSKNEVVVHGLPTKELKIKEGDILSIDIGFKYKGLFTDMAETIPIEPVEKRLKYLIRITKEALSRAIKTAKAGNHLGDIGFAIEDWVEKHHLTVIEDLVGHGVGYDVHEEPAVYNWGEPGQGLKLENGMVLAIEPMVTFTNGKVRQLADGSFVTESKEPAAHFEHTIVVTKKGGLILTKV